MNDPLKIFIVDNSRMLVRSIERALASEHSEIESASSAASGLMRLIRWHPRVVITGVEVGEINGFELCQILKLMPSFAGMPVIILSSNTTKLSQRQAAEAGADFFLPKNAEVVGNLAALLRTRLDAGPPEVAPPAHASKEIRRVLVVDDSKVMRRIIRNILAGVGITDVVEAGNGQEALKRLELNSVDLIMTDWNMPVMNGLELARAVRRQPRWAALPIAMVTTEGTRDATAEAKAAGVNDLLCKPFSHDAMKAFIARFA